MEDNFQNDKYKEYFKKDSVENEKSEKSEKSKGIGRKIYIYTNPNLPNNKGNDNNFIKNTNLNQGEFNKHNSMNLNYQSTNPNFNDVLLQAKKIIDQKNFYMNGIPNFNANQNYYPNQMFPPNNYNNYAQFNDLRQNIFPYYYPQFNNFNPYNFKPYNNSPQFNNIDSYINNQEKNYLLDLNQEKSIDSNNSNKYNAVTYIPKENEEQEDETKIKKNIDSTYRLNVWRANFALKNNRGNFLDSKDNSEKEGKVIYKTTNTDIEFIEKLNKINAVLFKDLEIPEITYEMIEQKIKNAKYEKTEEDNIILKECENNAELKCPIYFNKYIFYLKNKISLFTPHYIRTNKNVMSLFFPEKLNLSDFLYTDYHKNLRDDIFLQLLSLRINQFNDFEKKDGIITDKKYNEKIFGFKKNLSKQFYLYSIMDEEIISEKIKNPNINTLFDNLIAAESQIDKRKKPKSYDCYEIFNRNMDFLKGLTYKKLILSIILNKIDKDKYEIFPRILFYEYYISINGEKVVFSNKIEPGYSEAHYVFYSKFDYIYEKEPLIVQKKYKQNYNNLSFSNGNFEIESNTLYFIEFNSLFNFSEEKDRAKRFLKYEDFFKKLFDKYKEFIYLYESRKWIEKDTKREILLFYDNDIIEISEDIENIINNLLKENPNCTFKIIYTFKTYSYFSYSLAIGKHNQLEQRYEKLSKENEEMSKKIEELLKENKEIKEQLEKNGTQINNKEENNEKKNEVSQNGESNEKKKNLTNNNISEVNNKGKNNNETKKDEN